MHRWLAGHQRARPGGREAATRQVRVGIERVHLEEDTGKSLHVGGATGRIHGADYSLVDYNRAGIPLVEIVTKPVTGTGALAPVVAHAYVTELRDLLRALDVSDVRMEEGSLRCDVNTSLAPRGADAMGHPDRDQERQLAALGGARGPVRDRAAGRACWTRAPGWSRRPGTSTRTPASPRPGGARKKHRITATSPSPTWSRSPRRRTGWTRSGPSCLSCPRPGGQRLQAEWGLSDLDMAALRNAGALDLVAATVAAGAGPADASKWWLGELLRRANESGTGLADLPITPEAVARVAALQAAGTVNDRLAREVIDGVLAGEGTPDEVVAGRGLAVVSDDTALSAAVDEAIAAHPDVAQKIRDGKVAAAGALVGAVMKATKGKADASRVRELILGRLTPS